MLGAPEGNENQVTDEQRETIIGEYNRIVRATGEPKRAFRELRRVWRERLKTQHNPFGRATLYRWAVRLGMKLVSSRMRTNETNNSLPDTQV